MSELTADALNSRTLPSTSSSSVLEHAFAWLAVGSLFGDWMLLSGLRLATGTDSNWLLAVAALQVLALGAAFATGRIDSRVLRLPLLGILAFGALLLTHVGVRQITGEEMLGYGVDKVLSWFLTVIPAFLVGYALAVRPTRVTPRVFATAFIPLLAVALIVAVQDREQLTLNYLRRMPVLAGVIVVPVHQALAFSLAKGGLWSMAQNGPSGTAGIRRLHLAILLVSAGLILLSGARTYLMAFIAACGTLLLFGRRAIVPSLLAVLIIAPLAEFLVSESLLERYDPARALHSLAWVERVESWEAAWSGFLEAPLFGLGAGGYAEHIYWAGRAYPHNLALEFACEGGLFGMTAIAATMIATLTIVVKAWASQATDPVMRFGAAFLVFALIGAAAVGDWVRNAPLFLAVGICVGAAQRAAPERQFRGSP